MAQTTRPNAINWFEIPARDLDAPARTLSGGNAQRVVVGRELADPHAVTVAAQPTRGIDVGAKAEIYKLLDALAALSHRASFSVGKSMISECAVQTSSTSELSIRAASDAISESSGRNGSNTLTRTSSVMPGPSSDTGFFWMRSSEYGAPLSGDRNTYPQS